MKPTTVLHWWSGLLVRSLLAVVGIAMLTGGLTTIWITRTVSALEHEKTLQGLTELIDAVENTASVACFAGDEQLARDVAQGLLRSSNTLRVVIRAGEGGEGGDAHELARYERASSGHVLPTHFPANLLIRIGRDDASARQVVRSLRSPFDASEVVGQIAVDADWQAIVRRVQESVLSLFVLLTVQMALVIAAVALTVSLLIVKPIKRLSDRLHHTEPTSDSQLEVPEGHETTEIGRLVGDINTLTGCLVATLEQERALQRQQAIAQRKYQDLFDHAASGIFVADREGNLRSFNRAFARLTWLTHGGETEYRRLTEVGWINPPALIDLLTASLDGVADDAAAESATRQTAKDDFKLVGRRGDERWLHVAMLPVGDGSVQGTVTDVTQRKLDELSARRLAVVDSLTGFANRAGLQDLLTETLLRTPVFALVMLDLDGFKQINDSMGFPVGDQLLLQAGERMRACLQAGDSAARIGGDEFVLLLAGEHAPARLGPRIARLLSDLEQPYILPVKGSAEPVSISASIGVATCPTDGGDLHQLLRSAELALNSVRDAGGRSYRHFDPALLAAAEHRRRLEDDLRQALGTHELRLAFQPIVDLASGRLVGAEALLRWAHPVRGMVSPEVFIPLAEEIGLIGEIGQRVLVDACRQVAAWREGGHDWYVSVNVSVKQIPDAMPPAAITRQLAHCGLPASALAIEITEGVLMSNVGTAQSWIASLRAAGVRVYLDDFGTGYSSLSYLKRFSLDTVKIDKSFIRDMNEDNSDRALVNAIITMARSLGLRVVAEGVETAAQLAILRQLGCCYGQGYLFSRPVGSAEFLPVAAQIERTLATPSSAP